MRNRNRRTLPVMSREGGGNVTGTNNSSDTNGGGNEWLEQLSSSQSTIMEAGTRYCRYTFTQHGAHTMIKFSII